MIAAQNGHLDCVGALVAAGADVNAKTQVCAPPCPLRAGGRGGEAGRSGGRRGGGAGGAVGGGR